MNSSESRGIRIQILIRFNILLVFVEVESCFTKGKFVDGQKKIYFDTNQEQISEVFMDEKKKEKKF